MPTIISMGAASARAFGFGGAKAIVTGQQAYTTAGTYSWVAPACVTKVSVVAVGAGGKTVSLPCCAISGGGGGLGYKNNITVVPGNSYSVVVGATCFSTSNANSYFCNISLVKGGGGSGSNNCGVGGTYVGDGGGGGGSGNRTGSLFYPGGGGAGGYSGAGGCGYPRGPQYQTSGVAGLGGGGGGGGKLSSSNGGGGVGILGQGSNGAGGRNTSPNARGGGGSGGVGGGCVACGGAYGGGAGCKYTGTISYGGNGAVRIIWPGTTRQFPSTCTGDK